MGSLHNFAPRHNYADSGRPRKNALCQSVPLLTVYRGSRTNDRAKKTCLCLVTVESTLDSGRDLEIVRKIKLKLPVSLAQLKVVKKRSIYRWSLLLCCAHCYRCASCFSNASGDTVMRRYDIMVSRDVAVSCDISVVQCRVTTALYKVA